MFFGGMLGDVWLVLLILLHRLNEHNTVQCWFVKYEYVYMDGHAEVFMKGVYLHATSFDLRLSIPLCIN